MDAKTDICNDALGRIGSDFILNFEEESKNAKICRRFFKKNLRSILRMHHWNSATSFIELPQSTDEPFLNSRWSKIYNLPPDYVSVVQSQSVEDNFQIVGNQIYSNRDPLIVEYVREIEDFTKLDPLLRDAIEIGLAIRIAASLRAEMSIEALKNELLMVLASARVEDAKQRKFNYVRASPYMESRESYADFYY